MATRSIESQVTDLMRTYRTKLDQAFAASFPARLAIYEENLEEQAPSFHRWPDEHIFSEDKTYALYSFEPAGPFAAVLTNSRIGENRDGSLSNISGIIDVGTSAKGRPRASVGWELRGIRDSFHEEAWRFSLDGQRRLLITYLTGWAING